MKFITIICPNPDFDTRRKKIFTEIKSLQNLGRIVTAGGYYSNSGVIFDFNYKYSTLDIEYLSEEQIQFLINRGYSLMSANEYIKTV